MKAIIIDDEVRGCQTLQNMIQRVAPDIEVSGMAHNGKDGLELISFSEPDLLFLDIQMPDMTGFDLLQKAGDIRSDIIFTTAYDEFALKAFRFAAVDYLLKPIDIDELQDAINRYKSRLVNLTEKSNNSIQDLLSHLKNTENSKLTLTTLDGLLFVDIEDILYLQSNSNYTVFHTGSKGKITVSKTMGEFEPFLEGQNFFRIHHSHLVNMARIEKYIKGDGGFVILADGSELEVSRRRKDDFIRKLEALNWRLK